MRIKKNTASRVPVLIALLLIIVLLPTMRANATGSGYETANIHHHNYNLNGYYNQWNWPSLPLSYMYFADGKPVRVEAVGDKVVIESYSSDYKLQSSKTIDYELPIFGGFYCGKNSFYIMFGQKNPDQSNSTEVVRVVKYDKNWQRKGSVSFYGINTYIPFDAGSSDFAEYGNMLYIRTSHEMYAKDDGVHHQANMTFAINTDNMTEVSSYWIVMNNTCGYVSHSFNQFIRIDGDKIVAVDHGDAHPRGILLGTYSKTNAAEGKLDYYGGYTSINMLSIPGNTGANFTGTSVGAFEISDKNYLVAASRVNFDDSFTSNTVRNVVLLVQPRGDLSSATKEIKFTNFSEGSGQGCGNPYLVKVSDNLFVLMWEALDTTNASTKSASQTGKYQAVVVDGNGNRLSEIKTFEGDLSDCKPVVNGNSVVWYTTGESVKNSWGYTSTTKSEPHFYELFFSNSGSTYNLSLDKASWIGEESVANEEQVKAFVTRFYTLILNREPEEDGINYWSKILLNKEQTGAEVAYGFVNSPEFTEEHPVDDTEFVKRMYAAFFDRDGGADGEAWWLGYLNKGYTRNYVLAGFTNSDEFKDLCAQYGIDQGSLPMDESMKNNPNPSPQPHVDGLNIDASNVDSAKLDEYIDRLYRLVLKREPEADGKQYWREEIIKGNPYNASTAAEIGFFNSPEYLAMNKTDEEFIMDCYLVFLNREAEESGFEYWKEKFRTGEYDRQKLIEVGVGHSNEFKDILRSYGFVIIE